MLADLGVRARNFATVHPAFGKFNNVQGSAFAILDIILTRLGLEGTLVTPSLFQYRRDDYARGRRRMSGRALGRS